MAINGNTNVISLQDGTSYEIVPSKIAPTVAVTGNTYYVLAAPLRGSTSDQTLYGTNVAITNSVLNKESMPSTVNSAGTLSLVSDTLSSLKGDGTSSSVVFPTIATTSAATTYTIDSTVTSSTTAIPTSHAVQEYAGKADTILAQPKGSTTYYITGIDTDITSETSEKIYNTGVAILNGVITAIQFQGDGSLLTSLNAAHITSGTIPAARLPVLTFTGTSHSHSASFTGSQGTTNAVSFTPSGTVTICTAASSGASYRPGGSISSTLMSVSPSTIAVNDITSVGSSGSLTSTYNSNSQKLTISWTAPTVPTRSSRTVVSGISTTSGQPTFTGLAVNFSGAFSGASITHTHTLTPSGSVSITGTIATGTIA